MAPLRSTRSSRSSARAQITSSNDLQDSGPTPLVSPIPSASKGKQVERPAEVSIDSVEDPSGVTDAAIATLSSDKQDLLSQLAQHGCVLAEGSAECDYANPSLFATLSSIAPSDQVLDDTLRLVKLKNQDLTVESFFQALATLDGNDDAPPSPAVRSRTPEKLHLSIPTPQKSSFSTLESPSTPSETLRPAFDFSSPPRAPSQASSESLLRTPPRLLPSLEPLPLTPRTQRLSAFSTISTPRPSAASARPTTRQTRNQPPPPPPTSAMVAAQVEGMGRVALSRSLLFSQLGPDSAREAIAAAALLPSTPPALVFGVGSQGEGPSSSSRAFDAFGHVKTVASSFSLKPRQSGGKIGSHAIDQRLGRVRTWLESDDEEEEELEEKRQLTWSAAPKEWEQDIAEEERRRLVERRLEPELEITYVDEEDMEEASPVLHQQVRVGGKNIRVLLTTKRKRVEEDGGEAGSERAEGDVASEVAVEEEAMEEVEEEEEVAASPARAAPKTRASLAMQLDRQESRRPNGKGRAVEDIVDCICHQPDDEEQPMIQCDECQVWLHLACLQIPSSKRLPQQWSCFRCTDSDQPELPSAKRVRIQDAEPLETIAGSPSTPTFSHQEPILVASSTSPRPRNNFYRGYAPDMALAPSPKSSPIRRHAAIPRSPVAHHVLPIPVTPKLTQDNRADYSPRSPLFYRTGRVRMVSGGGFEDPQLQGAWVGGWDGQVFGNTHGYEEHYPTDTDDDFQPKSWHDMTMTPSRTVASTFEWETPGRARAGTSTTTATPRTASQSFLSALHNENDSQEGGHQRAPSFAQRLFGSPTHQPRSVPSSTSAPYYPPSSSPLHPKGARVARQRVPSVPFSFQQPFGSASSTSALASNPFAAAVGSIARRGSLEYAASASPYRAQRPSSSMARSGSGGLEHAVALDGE